MSAAMTPDRLRRIAEVLESVLELEESLRAPYLAALARSDLELVRQVHKWLDTHEEATDPAGAAPREIKSEEDSQSGELLQVGPYRIVKWLGMGGMGTVHLAERSDDEFKRQVAVKVIRFGLDTPEIRRRFLSERQILAAFDHPNIAKMYEGGTTADGLPYLVMEYIEGQPIDRYCDEKCLSVVERLKLFRQVCAAVEYAHRNLVVHRDLKPSNVLVTDDGVPKLLDFGIAKLLDPEQFPITVEATETGHGPLTPNYASPEQIAAERVTTLSDVYSLGILLYKLLTGHLPFDRRSRSRELLAQEAARLEPVRPSLLVGPGAGTEAPNKDREREDSSRWSAEPSQHRRQLQGDLDNIVLMALSVEPHRRYGSAQLFNEDVERHLDGLPVRARQASALYRTGKFIRRHKLPVAIAAAFLTLIMGFLVYTLEQNREISSARDQALNQEKRAEKVAEFFVDLFSELSPEKAQGKELTSREILNNSSERLLRDEKADPTVRVNLLVNLANIHVWFGENEKANDLLRKAYDEAEVLGGKSYGLAAIALAGLIGGSNPSPDAMALAEKAATAFAESDALAELSRTYSSMALWASDLDAAKTWAKKGIQLGEEIDDPFVLASGYNNLSLVAGVRERDFAAATEAMEKAMELLRGHFAEDHPRLLQSLGNLAYLYTTQGRLLEAGELHKEALAKTIKVLGPDSPHTGLRHNNLAQQLYAVGEYAEAEQHSRQTLKIWSGTYGDDHSGNWLPLYRLCASLQLQNRAKESMELCDASQKIQEDNGRPGLLVRLTRCQGLRLLGDWAGANRCLEASIETHEARAKEDRFAALFLPTALVHLGSTQFHLGDIESAKATWERALEASASALEEKNSTITFARLEAKLRLGQLDDLEEEIQFLVKSGARSRHLELFCHENAAPATCAQLKPLFPRDPWPETTSL